MATSKQEGHYLSLRTVPVILKNGQHRMMVNALLDDASTHTYINEDVAAELGVQGQTQQVSVNVLNDKQEIFDSMLIDIGLESTDGSVDMNITALTTTKVTAQYITQEHAKSMEKELPLAAATVEKSTYMDDNMDSVDTNSKAIELYKQLQQLWRTAGMHARKWVSNSVQVLQEIPEEDRLKEINIQMSELPSVKALGLLWNAESDEFRFSFMSLKQDIKMTKRNFLKETAKLFDPLGFLGPFIIRARVLLQEMWISGVNWDETLSPDLEQKAWSWYLEIEKLCSVKIPRGLEVSLDTSKMKLHTFVDASEAAFGAVVYLVTTREDDTKSSYLVASKCHVAPLKAVSMPRLELLAAVLGVRLLLAITKALELPSQRATLWSDSQNVLWWIKRQSRCFKPFVANRIGYIQEHTNISQWKYVPSKLNAADILSRGVDAEALLTEKWLNGPEFMTHDETEWPKQTIDMDNTETSELKKPSSQVNIAMFTKSDPISWRLAPARFSSWKRLCRVSAWIFRFLNNARVPYSLRKKGELDPEEIEDAETTIMVRTQREEFSDDYSSLMRKSNLPSNSKLFGLQPYVDKNGLMRTGGRLRFADLERKFVSGKENVLGVDDKKPNQRIR
ncbi:uncharacterized protein [Haliotis cracherodii]|uniref:uncharacterized protein n=1 Tax=Haliotis cracherodii TaxID=6455 RepID=UPI0039ED2CB0